ncbi:MAG: HlyD family efflux transporter periplasmic adaptor subunit [Planctomycetia bacterium]|nr:HlyD family efflux transporter periplasmic adaptor subunit [Planctomycetia bacterium]
MLSNSLFLTMALALAAPAAPGANPLPAEVFVDNCKVVSIEDQEVPGTDAGVLATLEAKEGMRVKKDQELGRIDYREAEAQRKIKQYDYEIAEIKAKSDVTVQYAEKSADVAKEAHHKAEVANEKSKNTITAIEVMKLFLEYEKAVLTIKKEKEGHDEAKLTAKAKKAEVDAADVALDLRILYAPFDGVIVEVKKHPGEWVAPGEAVVRIVRVDRLRVHGTLNSAQFGPGDVEGRRVTVNVSLPRGATIPIQGKIIFASPVVDVGGKLPVYAEIDNPMDEDGRPVVRHGLDATMTIHLKDSPAAAARTAPRKSASNN